MPSRKPNNNSAAKPKSSRKRRQPLNYNPKPNKKRAVSSRTDAEDSPNTEDAVESDFTDVEIKDKTTKNVEDEERESGEMSEHDDVGNTNSDNTGQDPHQQPVASGRSLQRRTPATSQGDGPSQVSSVSPKLWVGGKNILENEHGIQIQTDKHFLQKQIQLLSTPFTLQDCPALSATHTRRKNCIPRDVMQDALRKLNHKMDDEIQKHLNRQCQRKVLSELFETEKDTTVHENFAEEQQGKQFITETMSVSEIVKKCSEDLNEDRETDSNLRRYSLTIGELRAMNDETTKIKQKIASCESNNLMVLEVECLAKEASERLLRKEVERTNKLVNQAAHVLRRKTNSDL